MGQSQAAAVRIAVVGVGNCAWAFAQGLGHYREPRNAKVGLMSFEIGGYRPADLEIVCAFDVTDAKVGRPLNEALAAPPNDTLRFAALPESEVVVQRGPTLDGLGRYLRERVQESRQDPVDVAAALRQSRADVLVSYLPVGSEQAARHYADAALRAGCGFVNCMPAFIASDPAWAAKFAKHKLPLIGDDVKSQLGATILHRALVRLMRERGVQVERTYQLNVGGNADFQTMLERERLVSKKLSKTRAVTSELEQFAEDDVHIGPSDYVPWLGDRKTAFIRVEGTGFGGAPILLDLKLEVWDSPNSAGVVIDAVRLAKLAADRGVGGVLAGPSAYLMKSPPSPMPDAQARTETLAFARGGDKGAL